MTGVVPIEPKRQFFDNSGNPLSGGTVDVYVAGSTTRTTTWQDKDQTSANTNPISLDAAGRCSIWGSAEITYKFVVKDSDGVEMYTEDNVPCAGTTSAVISDLASSLFNRVYLGGY